MSRDCPLPGIPPIRQHAVDELRYSGEKSIKVKKYQNIWNLLKDFISLHRQNESFDYPGKFSREGKPYTSLPI